MYHWKGRKQDYVVMLMWHRNKKDSKPKWHRMSLLTKIFNRCVMEAFIKKRKKYHLSFIPQ